MGQIFNSKFKNFFILGLDHPKMGFFYNLFDDIISVYGKPNMHKNINNLKSKYHKFGTVLIEPSEIINPISKSELKILEHSCKNVQKEFIEIGDAGENYLYVGRFMTDVKKPIIVKNPYSKSS